MLNYFNLMKYALAKMIRSADKIYNGRKRIPGLIKKKILSPINTIIGLIPPMLNVTRRVVVIFARPLPGNVKILFYYITYPLFKNVFQTRMFLAPGLNLETFFTHLKKREVKYVILRWFNDLPYVEPGEDIDILIDDHHMTKVSDLLTGFPVGQAFDFYSSSGIENTSFQSLPYYPPYIAEKILRSRVWVRDIYAVPDVNNYFFSLAYHVIYHKGKTSGLRNEKDPYLGTPDHDYVSILQELSNKVGMETSLTFQGLHELLKKNNWSPNVDTLRKLSQKNTWISNLLPTDTSVNDNKVGEFMVFVLREWVFDHHALDFIIEKMIDKNLDVLSVKMLDDDEKRKAAGLLRGGKWDRGPYPISGGNPMCLIACFDYDPKPTSEKQKQSYPFVKNKNIFIKTNIRNEINGGKLWFYWTNCIHAADDEFEAWDYIQQVSPQNESDLRQQVQKRRDMYRTDFPVIKQFHSNNTRAKIELIDYNGKKAVKKTFKLGCEKFCEREVFACKHFGGMIDTIPELFESGANYLITRWYDNLLEDCADIKRYQILAPHAKKIIDTLRLFFEEGYALVGFYPGNIIITPDGDVKIIDFEFLYKYPIKPASFVDSYDVAGLPSDFDGDLPRGMERGRKGHTYNNTWRLVFGPLKKYMEQHETTGH